MQTPSKLLYLAIAVAACAKSPAPAPHRDRALITRTEIDATPVNDAHALIQRLRPEYLRERGTATLQISAVPVVYVDGLRRGGLEVLRTLRTQELQEIRFVSSTDATTRYGMEHAAGAIEVKTRLGGRRK
jgi:hypothetical protein